MTEDNENNDIEQPKKSWLTSKKKQLGQKNDKLKNKMKESFEKTIHDQFHGILDKDKLYYTLFFVLIAIIISGFSLAGSNWITLVEIISLTFVISYFILFIAALNPTIRDLMFETDTNLRKTLIIIISSIIGLSVTFIYYYSSIPISWLAFSQLLPGIFVIIFLGWNIMQIHFIKASFQEISMKAETKLMINQDDDSIKKSLSITFLIIGILIPFLLHTLTIIGFANPFTSFAGSTPTSEEQVALSVFIAWSVFMYIVILITGGWQIRLFSKSIKNDRPNIFSNLFYMLIWVILWFRSFGFINTFRTATVQTGSDIFLAIGNVLLLVFTSIMVLRGLAERVIKTDIFSADSILFLVYALTIMYVAGQTIMIQGQFGDKKSLDMFNNTILLVSGIIYYLWYSNYIMQREGYIQRTLLTRIEVESIVTEFSDNIIEEIPEKTDIIEKNLSEILEKHKLRTESDDSESKLVEEELTIELEKSDNEELEFNTEEDIE